MTSYNIFHKLEINIDQIIFPFGLETCTGFGPDVDKKTFFFRLNFVWVVIIYFLKLIQINSAFALEVWLPFIYFEHSYCHLLVGLKWDKSPCFLTLQDQLSIIFIRHQNIGNKCQYYYFFLKLIFLNDSFIKRNIILKKQIKRDSNSDRFVGSLERYPLRHGDKLIICYFIRKLFLDQIYI